MTILVVCDVLGKESNGAAVATINLIRYLESNNYNVRVLCADETKKGKENYFIVPTKSFGKALDALVDKVGVALAKADKDVIAAALDGVDHVHIMLPFDLGLVTAKMPYGMGLPITAGFHMQAENLTGYVKLNRVRPVNTLVYKYIYKHLYRFCDGIHYPTQFIRDMFERRTKKTTPGYVISNGVHDYIVRRDVPKPPEYEDKIVILSTGRYSVEKSQDTLIKAVKKSKYSDKIQLILAGQGLKEKKFRKLAKKLPVPPVFKLFTREEIGDVLNFCDLYVHPAVYELEGVACLEGIACGKLTIVSDSKNSATRGFAADEKCVFKHRSPRDLARTIDYWIDHPDEKKACEEKYLRSPYAVRQETCMRQMCEMFEKVDREKAQARATKEREEATK